MTRGASAYSGKWRGVKVVVGPQWGDEGKGKIIDYLAEHANVVVRYSGGPNAGHTVVNQYGKTALHVIPSGIFYPKVLCMLMGGVVINPTKLLTEIDEIRSKKVSVTRKNLLISDSAQLILPWHQKRDVLAEAARGGKKIGTTGQGIGPTYSDRVSRVGLRTGDLLLPKKVLQDLFHREYIWQTRLARLMSGEKLISELQEDIKKLDVKQLIQLINKTQNDTPYNIDQAWKNLLIAKERLSPMIVNILPVLWEKFENGNNVLGEGAQGALLDLDLGTYPNVTSSNTGLAGFSKATGIYGSKIEEVYGVAKAYTTRVGSGPMPTELLDQTGEDLRRIGGEFGATTGRPRRCGWQDTMALRYGAAVSGCTSLALTKLDVLDDFPTVRICYAYKIGSKTYKRFEQVTAAELDEAKPVYEDMPGWMSSTTKARTFKELPQKAQAYVKQIEKLVELPVKMVSVGAAREATLVN